MLVLVSFLHWTDCVELMLLRALLVQLALLWGQLCGQWLLGVRLGVARGRRWGYVVRMRGLGVRVKGVLVLLWLRVVLRKVVHMRRGG